MSRHHDKRASEYAATLGWEVTRTANGHARMKCPYGCCLIIASTRKNGGYKNSMTRIRKCPGAADAALVKNVVDEFLSGLPPDPAVVEAWAATWTTDKTEAPQEPEATQPQTGEPKMAKRSYRPEVYELVTDFILEHPTRPWRPVVAEVQPGGLDDVVVIIGRSEDGTIVLQSTTEIIIAKIETTVPR